MAFSLLIPYLVFLFIRPHEWAFLDAADSPVIRLLLIACMGLFLLQKNKSVKSPHILLMALFTVTIVLSVLMTGWLGGALTAGEEFLTQSFIPFLLISALTDTVRKQHVIFAVIVIAALTMVHNGHFQKVSELGIGWAGNIAFKPSEDRRITYLGHFYDPNDLGMFLLLALPIIFYFKSISTAATKWAYWPIAASILYGIYLTGSRGTVVSLIFLAGTWFWRTYGYRKAIAASILASPGLLLLLSRFRSISTEDASAQGRLDAWYAGFEMLARNPIFGVGHEQFIEYHSRTAHNSFILVLSELGLLGGLIWAALLLTTMLALWSIIQHGHPLEHDTNSSTNAKLMQQESKIANTLLYCFLAYLACAFFLSRSYIPLLYVFIGQAAANYNRVQRLHSKKPLILFKTRTVTRLSFLFTFITVISIYALTKVGL